MSTPRLQRRDLLAAAGIGVGALGLYGIWQLLPENASAPPNPDGIAGAAPLQTLDELIVSGQWSPLVGETHLKQLRGKESSAETIRSTLEAALQATGASDIPDQAMLAVEQDFRDGRLCELDGWTLSINECRLSALAYLSGWLAIEEHNSDPLAGLRESKLLELEDWGPRSGVATEPFNPQPNGNSALWFRFSRLEEKGFTVFFGGHRMITSIHPGRNMITASLTPSQTVIGTASEGGIPITLVDFPGGRKQHLGWFTVRGGSEAGGGA